MKTKMNISLILLPDDKENFNSEELYKKLKPYGVNVTDLGDKVYLFATVDIRNDAIETIICETRKHGYVDIEAYLV